MVKKSSHERVNTFTAKDDHINQYYDLSKEVEFVVVEGVITNLII